MNRLNDLGRNLVNEVELANKFTITNNKIGFKPTKSTSTLALAYEKARNAVEYRDEHLIRQAAIERILKRRLFLKQSNQKIADLLIKELTWARYIESEKIEKSKIEKFKNIIQKYREAGLLIPNNKHSSSLLGLCACEIDEIINFNPTNQIIINFVSSTLEKIISFDEENKVIKSIQIYIATERSFAKNSEILIKHKLLKVLLPRWTDATVLFSTLDRIEDYLNYKYKDSIRRKVGQMSPPFNLIRDLVIEHPMELKYLTSDIEKLKGIVNEVLEEKYSDTRKKVRIASKRSIIYIFLTKMILALVIEIPFDIILGKINFFALSLNVLFPPSLMFLFNSRVKLPQINNSSLMTDKIISYLYDDPQNLQREEVVIKNERSLSDKIFYIIYIITSTAVILGIIKILNLLSFNLINQIIFLFFLSVVSFFAFRVREISNDYLLLESENDSLFDTLLDYIFLPIIKSGQWLSSQISKINILSFLFDFIIEAPLKTFLEIFEQWLHFVRVKKEEFLG